MANVTLVNLNQIAVPPVAPYAIDILGSALSVAGHGVEVLDLCGAEHPESRIAEYFGRSSPDIVGLTLRNTGDLYFPSFLDLSSRGSFLADHARLVAAIKQRVSAERIVMGGVGFSSNPRVLLSRFGLSHGIRGPGERALVDIADLFDQGASISEAVALCAGALPGAVSMVDARRANLATKVRRTFVDNKGYYDRGGLAGVRTTNGCGMRCAYCIEPLAKGQSFVRRQVDDVLSEIDELLHAGVHDIHTCDSEFNMPIGFTKEVLRGIEARRYPSHLRFWAYCQPKPFDEEFADLLAAANVVGVNFGIDHTDASLLNLMGKRWYTKHDIANSARMCIERGIAVNHECLFGWPGDNPELMLAALDTVMGFGGWAVGVALGLAVLPGTELARVYEGRLRRKEPLDGFYLSGEPLTDPAFFLDPSFHVPQVFDLLKVHVGSEIRRVMIPALNSTATQNNQLVGSERIKRDLEHGRRGAYWYSYPSRILTSTSTQERPTNRDLHAVAAEE